MFYAFVLSVFCLAQWVTQLTFRYVCNLFINYVEYIYFYLYGLHKYLFAIIITRMNNKSFLTRILRCYRLLS